MKKIFVIVALIFIMTGCEKKELTTITIDTSNAIDRSVVNLIREEKILEEYLPNDVVVKWTDMGSGGARKDALLADKVQFIATPSSQFLIYCDSGMPITLVNSLSKNSASIYSNNANIKEIKDLTKAEKIVVNSMTSDDYMLFKKLIYEVFGDYNYFDDKMLFMDESEIMTSLSSSKDIDVAILPYITAKQADEIKTLTKIYESSMDEPFERYLVTRKDFYESNPDIIESFIKAEEDAIKRIEEDSMRVSKLLAEVYEIDSALINDFLVKYPPALSVKNYDDVAELLYQMKTIDNKPKKLKELPNYNDLLKFN